MPTPTKGSANAAFSFFNPPAAAPLPGLAASAANRLPRWALVGMLLLYILHGLIHRDAWRGDDVVAIALARSTVEAVLSGNVSALLLPQLEGLAWNDQGPLWNALLALFMLPVYVVSLVNGTPVALHLIDDSARVALALVTALGLTALWKATDRFARRREAQPIDPLGVGPQSTAFGQTLGDCALLLAMATLGVIYPWHQAGTAAATFLLQALLLWSLATAPETPKRAGLQCGLIVAGALLTHGIGLALATVVTLVLVFRWVAPYRLVARDFFVVAVRWASAAIGLWIALTLMTHSFERVGAWWSYGGSNWAVVKWASAETASFANVRSWFKESLWTWWPLWPIALFALWRARRIDFSKAPHWAVPATSVLVLVLLGLAGPRHWEIHELAPIAGLAVISAFGLLSLPRPVVNLIDWFAVTLFTALGVFIWLYWTALNFGAPSALAQRVSILAPGIAGNANLYEISTGALATLAWLALIAWRIRRGSPRLWRPVVLSAGGLTLLWVLVTTLWLPAVDRILGQQTLANSMEGRWVRSAEQRLQISAKTIRVAMSTGRKGVGVVANDATACVRLSRESGLLDAIAVGLTRLPISNQDHCAWKLALFNTNETERGWRIVWQSSVAEDRRSRERFVLLERVR